MAAVTHATGYVPINPADGNPPSRAFKALHALLSQPSITDIRAEELIAPDHAGDHRYVATRSSVSTGLDRKNKL
jgi:hypothetical protein